MALWCTIRTFAKHAEELGNQQPIEPVFFVKPQNCITRQGPLQISQHPGEVHHEIECVIRLGNNLQPEAVAVGLDLTDRAAQSICREQQIPWAKGKCFTGSAVIGPFSDWTEDLHSLVDEEKGLALILTVNGVVVQQAPLSQMSITPSMQLVALQQWAPVWQQRWHEQLPHGGIAFGLDRLVAILQTIDGRSVSRFEANCI